MRFCEKCQLMVYNFDSVEQPEAERIVCQREGLDKVVLFKRSDGKFLSKNCPVGVARQRLTAGIVLAATVLSLSGGYFLVTQSAQQLVNLGTVASGSSGASADTAPVPGEPDPDGDGAAGGSDASSGARTGLPRANAMLLCAYSRQLAKSLRETYTPPGTIKKDGSKITVQVQISQSGKRIGYHLIESSGHSDIDSYVVKNVLAETYPAPRFHVGNCLPATITFDSKEVAVSIP